MEFRKGDLIGWNTKRINKATGEPFQNQGVIYRILPNGDADVMMGAVSNIKAAEDLAKCWLIERGG